MVVAGGGWEARNQLWSSVEEEVRDLSEKQPTVIAWQGEARKRMEEAWRGVLESGCCSGVNNSAKALLNHFYICFDTCV